MDAETELEHEVQEVPELPNGGSYTAVQEWTGSSAADEANVLRAEEKDLTYRLSAPIPTGTHCRTQVS